MAIYQWLSEYKEDKSRSTQAGEAVAVIIRAYALALEQKGTSGYSYLDTNKLPYPKEVIKDSFIFALKNSQNDKIKENLKVGLLFLPDWQDDVGEGIKGFASEIDISAATSAQLNSIQQVLLEQMKWNEVALVEANKIKEELAAQGLW